MSRDWGYVLIGSHTCKIVHLNELVIPFPGNTQISMDILRGKTNVEGISTGSQDDINWMSKHQPLE